MKNIKKYIQGCLVLVLVIIFGLSVIDTQEITYKTNYDYNLIETHIEKLTENGPRSIAHTEVNKKALEYIIKTLESYNIINDDTTEKPAYMVQEFVASDERYQNWYLDNIIVHIPANAEKKSDEAIMFMAHTDSVPMGDGASDDGVGCSIMLESIRYYLEKINNGYTLSNDIVFCFVNGEEYRLYGSEAFMKEFKGFNNVVDRIKFATNLESRGTSGTLNMFETSNNNYKTMELFAHINESVYTCSTATMVYDMMPNGTDFSNFKEAYQGLNFANISEGENYHTQNDSLENISSTYVTQYAVMIDKLIDTLGNYNLSDLYDTNESAIFFSYLNIDTIVYRNIVAIVLAIIAILLFIANILLSIFYRNEKNTKKTIIAIITTIIGIALGAFVTWICYYLFSFIAVIAGTININMIGTITYSNTWMIIGIGFVSLSCSIISSVLACKWFKIRYRDITRAQAYIHATLGIILSFTVVEISYLFIFSGIMLMVNELLITGIKKFDISEFHGELLATALFLPIIIPAIFLAISALGMTMSYVYGLLFTLCIFNIGVFFAPYCNKLSVRLLISKISKKEVKTSEIEGAIHILAIAMVIFFGISITKLNASVNLQGKQNIVKLPYDDALVYVVDENGDCKYRVYDLNAYGALKKYAPNMKYKESCYTGNGDIKDIKHKISSSATSNILNVEKTDKDSFIYLNFNNINGATSFIVDDGRTVQEYDISEAESYDIFLYTDCTVTLKNGSSDIYYKEVIIDYESLIPMEYKGDSNKLHFNLWLTTNFHLE